MFQFVREECEKTLTTTALKTGINTRTAKISSRAKQPAAVMLTAMLTVMGMRYRMRGLVICY